MKKLRKIVFATNNQHKLAEARQILSEELEIISLSEIDCHDEIPETQDTIEGNALQKARWVKARYGYDCFADDTGLMVDALDGAPGVYSARYAGEHCSPTDNVRKLLFEMKGKPDRKAHFETVIAYVTDREERIFNGRVEGSISEMPSGNAGFGYDPVFIASETGVTFADMTPDDKNRISHRGRALRKFAEYLGFLLLAIIGFATNFSGNAAEWRLHPSYDGQMISIAETPDYVYFLGARQEYSPSISVINQLNGELFRFSKDDQAIEHLSIANFLSGNTIKCIAYNYDRNYLAVAYDDGNIDLIFDDGTVRNVPGLKVSEPSLEKGINSFSFDAKTNKIYAATDFGYVVIDDRMLEIDTSRIFNVKCVSVAYHDGKILLATEKKLYMGDPDEFDFGKFIEAQGIAKVQKLYKCGGKIYMLSRPDNKRIVSILNVTDDKCWASPLGVSNVRDMENCRDGLLVMKTDGLVWFNNDEKSETYDFPPGYDNSQVVSLDGKTFWFSSGRKGISCLRRPDPNTGNWTVLIDRFFPNASTAFMCASMAYHPDYGMLVRNHGYEIPFNSKIVTTDDLISGYKDMIWTPLSATYRTDMQGLRFDNPFGLTIDPSNSNHVYCGSERSGLLRLDLANPEKSIHMSKPSDFLGGYGQPGFAAIVPDNDPKTTWADQCVFAAPKFDSAGNLWTAFVNPEKANGSCVSSYTELWIWPESARKATTSANNVSGWKQIRFDDLETDNVPMVLPLTSSANKNIVLHCGNTVKSPMLIFDHNGTIDNRADDKISKMKSVTDQDGNSVAFVKVHAWYEDTATGLVWVSYGGGLFTFSPREALTSPGSVRRIKVARNDGTNLADYLLDNVQVNYITSDNQGRKWFCTSGAGLVCTSSDGRQILATYTPDNSMIPGSSVYSACYNPAAGSMMISTDKGLCELFVSASSNGSGSDIKAYPNPVRPDYFGYVTIEGLPQDAMAKIVDAVGNLVKELGRADNGTLLWDVTNLYFKRVPGGVYYVMASNGPNADSYSEVSKILVVN